eukprot:COSAG01_NODE_858_length_13069_cov_23.641943_16_plen_61_part_00
MILLEQLHSDNVLLLLSGDAALAQPGGAVRAVANLERPAIARWLITHATCAACVSCGAVC